MKKLERYFDHTLLKADVRDKDIKKICTEAKLYGFYAVCVNPFYVSLAYHELEGSEVKVASVIGFPLGANETATKVFETKQAICHGASEIDMVMNIGALKDKNHQLVKEDIHAVVEACAGQAIVKVILETCLLNESEIIKACELSRNAGAHFVKTSTGFLGEGATVKNVSLMKKTVGDTLGIKASGGIRSIEKAKAMIEAGADRIGASASLSIMEAYKR